MRKLATTLIAIVATTGLAACGSSTDASEEAMADNVEMPADDAMADVPDPVLDEDATLTAEEVETDAMDAAEEAEDMVNDDVEDAIGDAESSME